MKICIMAQGPALESAFEPHFARAPYFILYDTCTGIPEGIRNGFVVSDSRIGQNTVRLLKMNGVETVIAREIGANARDLLHGAGIRLHLYAGNDTVRDAIGSLPTESG